MVHDDEDDVLVDNEESPNYSSIARDHRDKTAPATSSFLTATSAPSPGNSSDIAELELNDIYKQMGTGRSQYLYWLLTGLISYTDYAEMTLISLIILPLRCEMNLSPEFETLTTVTIVAVYTVFTIIAGKIADNYGRKTVLVVSTNGLIVAAVISAMVSDKWLFLLFRSLAAGFIGMNVVVASCYAVEFAESRYRIVGLTVFILTGYFGLFVVNSLAWALLKIIGWRWFIIILTAPGIPAVLLALYLPESPRYLCVSGKQEKAMEAVKFMARLNKTEIQDDVRMICHKDQDTGSYLELISPKHRRSTIALAIIFAMNIFAEFGIVLFLPLYFSSDLCGASSEVPKHTCTTLSQDDLFDLTVAALGTLVGSVGALLMAHFIGRLYPIRVTSFLQALFTGLLFICLNKTATFWQATFVRMFIATNNGFIWIIMPETYPTSIRSTAVGVLNGLAKVGGILGTGSIFLFFYIDPNINLGLFLGTALLGVIGAMIFNKKTKEVDLTET